MLSEKLLKLMTKKDVQIVVSTGAGISKESGIPTFRDPDGLWSQFRPEELANMDAFLKNPQLVVSWYQYRRDVIRNVDPNPGHTILKEWQDFYPHFTLVTQNVDDLHRRAGNTEILELHGSIHDNHCASCGAPAELLVENDQPVDCQHFGGKIRPGVVWFGENLPADTLTQAFQAAENADVFFSIGTSGVVYPAAGLGEIAGRAGAWTVEINPFETELSSQFDEILRGPSGEVLPQLWSHVKSSMKMGSNG